VFCPHQKTIKHLLFECSFARSIWSSIQIASNLYSPKSVANVFGNWLHGIDKKLRTIIRVGAIAVIWSLWLSRNDKVFNDKSVSPMQVLYCCTSIIRFVVYLTTSGTSRPLYGVMCMTGTGGEGHFFTTWMTA